MQPFAPIANIGPGIAPKSLSQFRAFTNTPAPPVSGTFGLHVDLVHPQFLALQEWADALVLNMSHLLPLPQLDGEADFERWAAQIADEPILQTFQIPRPSMD